MIIHEKVALGISLCMYGAKVRYNRKGWDMLQILERERNAFHWHPVCPEIEAGLGTPRDSIRLVGGNGIDVWEGRAQVMKGNQDITEEMKEACLSGLKRLQKANVSAYVFMEGSPSCGVYRTTLKGTRMGRPPGVFGALLYREGFFLIPAQDLQSQLKWWDWRRRLFAFLWLKDQKILSLSEFYDAWHVVKFLCQEIDNERAREMGKTFAQFDKKTPIANLEYEREQILDLLRKPSDVPRIKQSLWKSYSFYRKNLGIEIEEIKEPSEIRNVTHLVEEVTEMEKVCASLDILFGASPVIYRP